MGNLIKVNTSLNLRNLVCGFALSNNKTELRYLKFLPLLYLVVARINHMKIATTASLIRFVSLAMIATLSSLSPAHAQVQDLPDTNNQVQPIDPNDPNNLRPTSPSGALLSVEGGKRLMSDAQNAVSSQNYSEAAKKFQDARSVFNQLSNFYQQLNSSFSGIDNRVADNLRKQARDTAQMRDEATYQLALVHRAQNKPSLAVPLLVQIIRSQMPTRDLGKKAYQQLLELGFVDAPSGGASNTSSSPSSSPKK